MSEQKTKTTKTMKRRLKGEVVSTKMANTIIVRLTRMKMHPKYQKQYKINKRYKVHDAKGIAQVGNQVIFEECRPISKDKKWKLVKVIK